MAKIRVYELAKKIGVPAAQLLQELKEKGVAVSSNFSVVEEDVLSRLWAEKGDSAPASLGKTKAKAGIAKGPALKVSSPVAAAPVPASPAGPPVPSPPKPKPVPILHRPASSIGAKLPPPKAAAPAEPAPAASAVPKVPVPQVEAKPAPEPEVHKAPGVPPPAVVEPAPPSAPAEIPAAPPEEPPAPVSEAEPAAAAPQSQAPQKPVPLTVKLPPGTVLKRPPMLHTRPYTPPSATPVQPPPSPRPPQAPAPSGVRKPAPPIRRPAAPAPRPAAPRPPAGKPGTSAPRPGAARPQAPAGGRPAPAAPAAETRRPAPAAPPRSAPPEVRRKTKRERRMEKMLARADRQERLEHEIQEAQARAEKGEAVFIREGITVKELAEKLNVKVKDIIAKLMMRGILATINQPLDSEVAIQISSMFGFQAEVISFEDEMAFTQEEVPEEARFPRAPVVTVMGHVDHGKSSLLEAIHDVDITSKEFGGITQHIGAYKVRHGDREYVFLDTPGHEAFTLMRARGAQVTDVVILVVAADDGVMPQTVEAIHHCKAANVPMVVAINKMDKPGADPDRVKRELMQHGIVTEDFGGDAVAVPVSAKSRQGIEELLEMVALVADMLSLTASPEAPALGTVLESKLDRSRGPVATVLVQDGSLRIGDFFLCGSTVGHVRGLFDDKGNRLEEAGASTPVEVLGFSEVPAVGSTFQAMADEAKARQVAAFRKEQEKQKALRSTKVRLENVFGAIQQGDIQELSIILKADVQGSLEAIAQQVEELSTEEVKVSVVHKGVGAISEGDVLLASASNAILIGFNVRPERKAAEMAKAEGVEIALFTVIYDLTDRLKQALTGMLKPIEQEVVLGHAEVKEIFRVSKVGTVAGCLVSDGRIPRTSKVRVLRDNVVVHTGKIASLKRFKDDASEVKEGLECGISLENYNDVKPGDVLEAFEIQVQERTL